MTETEERTYTFSELSEPAKDKARDALRYSEHYLCDEWWDGVYEDAARMAEILGLDIMETERPRKSKSFLVPAINFSGFSSQGNGACFRGSYRFSPEAVAKMTAETNDEELIRIATALHTLQVARRLQGLEPFTANITTPGWYSHSGSMDVDVNSEDKDDEHCEVGDDFEDEVTQLMRDFADWVYKSLEDEHDYLTSDEAVDEQLDDETFDEDGSVI